MSRPTAEATRQVEGPWWKPPVGYALRKSPRSPHQLRFVARHEEPPRLRGPHDVDSADRRPLGTYVPLPQASLPTISRLRRLIGTQA